MATTETSVWVIHPFLLLTSAAVAFEGDAEIAVFCLLISVVHGVQLGTGGPQLVMVVANLARKTHFSCKSHCCFCVPWLDQEPQLPSCESPPNKTVKDSRARTCTTSEASAKWLPPGNTHSSSGCRICIRKAGCSVQQERMWERWKRTLWNYRLTSIKLFGAQYS